MPSRNAIAKATLIAVVAGSSSISALNTSTHRLINIEAAKATRLEAYVRDTLGLSNSSSVELTGRDGKRRTIVEWLGEGGIREDDGLRFFNHFHDPLKPWSEAGLQALVQQESSIRWMQDPNQAFGGAWAWSDARRLYLEALTAASAGAREEAAADMFRTLGQIMHLVVDASVPEHTRADPHPFGTIARLFGRQAGNYEYWVSHQRESLGEAGFIARYLSNPIGFDGSILQMPPPAGEHVATVPVARLIDTDRYTADAPNPNVTLSSAVGLAEFANANFFSENTLNAQFPFPRRDALVPSPRVAPKGSHVRAYLAKPAGQGQPTNVALAECASERAIGRWAVNVSPPYPCVDEAVWEETASHMLPRAVGYARGVLDYFFRGKLRVRQVITFANNMFIDIENGSGESLEGVFEVYARHHKGSPAEQRQRVGVINGGNPIALGPGSWNRFPLQMSGGAAVPYHVLVFRGRLGLEEDAILGQVFAVPVVQIVQESYQADVTKTCSLQHFESPTKIFDPVKDVFSCLWRPVNHRVAGVLVTNFPNTDGTDTTDPAISRLEAFWTGSVPGPAPLTINGVRYASGVWIRQADEPHPDGFVIADPADRGDSRLMLSVSLRSGERLSTQLATFKRNTESSQNEVRAVFLANGSVEWILHSFRFWQVEPNVDRAAFSIASVGGYPVPTPARFTDKLSEHPAIWREVLQVTTLGVGFQLVTNALERYPLKASAIARMSAFALESRFPQPPELSWTAVVTRKPPTPDMLQFWNAFGGALPSYQITMRADELIVP